jgi:endo-1,4-beta-xylanase
VGLQGHLVSEKTGTQSEATPSVEVLTKVLQDYADLNVDSAYTELDIRMNTPSNANKLKVQADCYARVAQSCINVSRCVGITLWVGVMHIRNFFVLGVLTHLTQGVSDKYSWVPNTFSGEGSALLWDNNYAKKPAYTAFLNALQAASTTS